MYLGIETNAGHVYEGASSPQFAVWPPPLLSLAKLIELPHDWSRLPTGLSQAPLPWIFREGSFDPVTRVRRGRLYEPFPDGQPRLWQVSAHPFDHEGVRQVAAQHGLSKNLYTFWPCQSFVNRPDRGHGTTVALGTGRAASGWRVVQVETVVGDDVMITLKAISAFGIIPDIDKSKIDEVHREPVSRAIERVVDSAFRDTPISVVDHCRNAANVVLSRWAIQKGASDGLVAKDLAHVSKVIDSAPFEKHAARDAAEVIRRLHPRGKANEQETKGLRVPVEEDAEMAVHALGFILREVGWSS